MLEMVASLLYRLVAPRQRLHFMVGGARTNKADVLGKTGAVGED